jgi:hypothetical protein
MTDMMMVFACLNQSLHPTVLRQLTVLIFPFDTFIQ